MSDDEPELKDMGVTSYEFSLQWAKRGTCPKCGRVAVRRRTFTASCHGDQEARVKSISEMWAIARAWTDDGHVFHKGCEA